MIQNTNCNMWMALTKLPSSPCDEHGRCTQYIIRNIRVDSDYQLCHVMTSLVWQWDWLLGINQINFKFTSIDKTTISRGEDFWTANSTNSSSLWANFIYYASSCGKSSSSSSGTSDSKSSLNFLPLCEKSWNTRCSRDVFSFSSLEEDEGNSKMKEISMRKKCIIIFVV